MSGIDGVGHARLRLEAEDERVHEVAARHLVHARVGKQRRGDGRRGVAVVLRRRVVVVVDVRADAVQQRRVQRIDPFDAPEDGCDRLAGVRPEGAQRDVHGRMRSPTDGAAHVVHDGPARLVAHVHGDVFQLIVNDVRRERFCL